MQVLQPHVSFEVPAGPSRVQSADGVRSIIDTPGAFRALQEATDCIHCQPNVQDVL